SSDVCSSDLVDGVDAGGDGVGAVDGGRHGRSPRREWAGGRGVTVCRREVRRASAAVRIEKGPVTGGASFFCGGRRVGGRRRRRVTVGGRAVICRNWIRGGARPHLGGCGSVLPAPPAAGAVAGTRGGPEPGAGCRGFGHAARGAGPGGRAGGAVRGDAAQFVVEERGDLVAAVLCVALVEGGRVERSAVHGDGERVGGLADGDGVSGGLEAVAPGCRPGLGADLAVLVGGVLDGEFVVVDGVLHEGDGVAGLASLGRVERGVVGGGDERGQVGGVGHGRSGGWASTWWGRCRGGSGYGSSRGGAAAGARRWPCAGGGHVGRGDREPAPGRSGIAALRGPGR